MCTRLAEIMSNIYLALGQPPSEWLSLRELWYGTKTISAKYIEAIQQSDQNQIISVEEINFNNQFEYDLAAVVGKGVPAWLERQTGTNKWEMVQVVNLHSLEQERNNGRKVSAFYGNIYGSFIVKLSYQSKENHRLWYDPEEAFDLTQDSESVLPRNFNRMLEIETAIFVLPMMLNNAVRKVAEGKEFPPHQILAWNKLGETWREQLFDWQIKWKRWLHRSRGAQTSGMRPRRFIRNLYG